MNKYGRSRTLDEDEWGLLLFNGGTVCDDGFRGNTARLICKELGYTSSSAWTSGDYFELQKNLEIKLDNLICLTENLESCSYSTDHDCTHSEDVFLICTQGKMCS